MNKITLFFNVFFCLTFVGSLRAQTFVSTEPSNRNVVLEEYTGVYCVYCPFGHKAANQLAADNPGRVVVVNIHQGPLANSNPDYKTQWGDALAGQTGLEGYPSGTLNRHIFADGRTALRYASWKTHAPKILKEQSCVNVAAQSTIDWNTRKLTVIVEAYYTGNSNMYINMLNVAILQDNIFGQQSGAADLYPEMIVDGLYRHNHMLRDLITGQWGETMPETTQGSFFTRTYTYDIPSDYRGVPVEMADLKIAVFVAEGRDEIITGSISKIGDGTGVNTVEDLKGNWQIYPNPVNDKMTISFTLNNSGSIAVSVCDILGREVITKGKVLYAEGNHAIEINTQQLRAGGYIVKLQTCDGVVCKKILVRK